MAFLTMSPNSASFIAVVCHAGLIYDETGLHKRLQMDYIAVNGMFINAPPSFSELMETIAALEKQNLMRVELEGSQNARFK